MIDGMMGPSAFILSVVLSVGNSYKTKFPRSLVSQNLSSRLFSSTTSGPPTAKKIPTEVYFGVNPSDAEESRGAHAMNPPRVRVDEYFWLRDESRESEEVHLHFTSLYFTLPHRASLYFTFLLCYN